MKPATQAPAEGEAPNLADAARAVLETYDKASAEKYDECAWGELRGGAFEELRAALAAPAPQAPVALTDEQVAMMRTAGYLDADDYPDAWAYERGVRDAESAHRIPAPAHANDRWTVISPTGQVFTGESPFRAASAANKQWVKTDPEAAKRFTDMIERMRAENEAENARLLAEHGTLNCPACGGSGHIGDVQAPAVAHQPAAGETWHFMLKGASACSTATVEEVTTMTVQFRGRDGWPGIRYQLTDVQLIERVSQPPVQGSGS